MKDIDEEIKKALGYGMPEEDVCFMINKQGAYDIYEAGYEQSVLDNDNWACDGYGYKLGIREVVEWCEEECEEHLGIQRRRCGGCREAKLKELGYDTRA